MAVKKSELYKALWASCDALRGGMDASEYKDYILTLLFMKYVTDKSKGAPYYYIQIPKGGSFDNMLALKGKPNIGEGINKIIKKLAEENDLSGIIDVADFDDEKKLGAGKDKVDTLTELVAIFETAFDFSKNRASGDDIIGDAYEYLMRNFATESGKSKGQFYTPAEVSRIMAKILGISEAKNKSQTVYDPACGSGSLLIRAADEAPNGLTIYGQEKESKTAGLAKMNLVLHNKGTGKVEGGKSTFSNPAHLDKDNNRVRQFDFVVANPPFSLKNWKAGLQEYDRFNIDDWGAIPPEKNGDYAWLLHCISSLNSNGKGAVILPHGVLFRGNAEAVIREKLIKSRIIKGIIGLPTNLFYGTGIPACIIVIDKAPKQEIMERKGIYIMDASKGFIKDGNKNRLREQDIRKIVDYFTEQKTDDPSFAKFVKYSDIEKNDYNLNITRYIDAGDKEDFQNIEAHLKGGIPLDDVKALSNYWNAFDGLEASLFTSFGRRGFCKLRIYSDEVAETISKNHAFIEFRKKLNRTLDAWIDKNREALRTIKKNTKPKEFIENLGEDILKKFKSIPFVDKYDIYECLLSYWDETMQDDVYAIVQDGYEAAREIDVQNNEGKIIPKNLLAEKFFADLVAEIDEQKGYIELFDADYKEEIEENIEDGLLTEVLNEKDELNKSKLNARIKKIKNLKDYEDEYVLLLHIKGNMDEISKMTKTLKISEFELDHLVYDKFQRLTLDEIKHLLIVEKWESSISDKINDIYERIYHTLTSRVTTLAERYENTLPELTGKVEAYEKKVRKHLKGMGFVW
jgi:type I restriction enzyme M protein